MFPAQYPALKVFRLEHVAPDGRRTPLLQRRLDLVTVAGDRGLQEFDLDIPDIPGEIVFTVDPGPQKDTGYDWTYWHDLRFGLRP